MKTSKISSCRCEDSSRIPCNIQEKIYFARVLKYHEIALSNGAPLGFLLLAPSETFTSERAFIARDTFDLQHAGLDLPPSRQRKANRERRYLKES